MGDLASDIGAAMHDKEPLTQLEKDAGGSHVIRAYR